MRERRPDSPCQHLKAYHFASSVSSTRQQSGCVHHLAPGSPYVGSAGCHTQFRHKTPALTIIILPDPPETGISGVFLGIGLSERTGLGWVRSPWLYVLIPTPGKSWLKRGDKGSDLGLRLAGRCRGGGGEPV